MIRCTIAYAVDCGLVAIFLTKGKILLENKGCSDEAPTADNQLGNITVSLPRARMREAGLSNGFCPSVCQSVIKIWGWSRQRRV